MAATGARVNEEEETPSCFFLRLERGGGQRIFLSCACFLITQPFLNIYRHAIHQMKAEYHSYLLVSIILYN